MGIWLVKNESLIIYSFLFVLFWTVKADEHGPGWKELPHLIFGYLHRVTRSSVCPNKQELDLRQKMQAQGDLSLQQQTLFTED